MKLMTSIKFHWRRLCGRCVMCNVKVVKCAPFKKCPHCAYRKYLCHWCGKKTLYAMHYGVSNQTLHTILTREK